MPIKILSDDMASKIAAGEVVERPSSVVKELVENSIDAGASIIAIEIWDGGRRSIRVTDNGTGIPMDEIPIAFQRFATSKISVQSDLENINSLGFRGEALPSIASVSEVDLTTRDVGSTSGSFLKLDGSTIVDLVPKSSPIGTSITVENIFSKFPARLKFLKAPSVESSRIQVVIKQMAMAFPDIKFSLEIDGKQHFSTSGIGDLRGACSDVYGHKIAATLIDIVEDSSIGIQDAGISIKGLIGPPEISRSNRSSINLMVNRRIVQSRSLLFAIDQAYHGFLKERRHPIAIVNIHIPLDELDVNVHPAKSEVRFLREGEVFSSLQKSVRNSLLKLSPLPNIHAGGIDGNYSLGSRVVPRQENNYPRIPMPVPQPKPTELFRYTPREAASSMHVIGQSQRLYILADGPEGLFLVDQHAAHERILYEDVNKAILQGDVEIQGLLSPPIIDLPPGLLGFLYANASSLNKFGFNFDWFGSNAVLLRSIPLALRRSDPTTIFLDILEEARSGRDQFSWQERLSKSLACHSAVRAGDTMTLAEMEQLISSLQSCNQPNTCPHGRPTMIHLTGNYLESRFGRT